MFKPRIGNKVQNYRQNSVESYILIIIPILTMVSRVAVPKAAGINCHVPQPDFDKLKELTHYIISKCGSAPNFGNTLLWKMLYFSDFDHYELYSRSITKEAYRKIERGPAPCNINNILNTLQKENKIAPVKGAKFYDHELKKFTALQEPKLIYLSADEIKVVDKVIRRLSAMTAKQASEYSHLDTPWKATDDKGIIDYKLVFYRAPITSVKD